MIEKDKILLYDKNDMFVIDFIDSLYSKLPDFGKEIKDFIAKVLPFVSLVVGILIVFSSIIDLLGTPFLTAFTTGGGATIFQKLMIVNILGLIEGVLLIVAFRGLRKRKMMGWRLIFWSQVIFIFSAILSFSPSFVLGLLFFYPLFQIRGIYR